MRRLDTDRPGSTLRLAVSSLRYATKSELVYQYLREAIVSGALLPGEHLYLDETARQLGVSTNPIRESLRRLESEGLVTNRPHVGATVAAIDPEKIEVHFMIRAALEGLAVRLAVAHLTPEIFEQLATLDQQLTELGEAQDFRAWDERNLTFYRLLFDCSHSSDLVALIDVQRDRSPRYRHFPGVLSLRAQETRESRRSLLAALRARDVEGAERLHRANVTRVGQLLGCAMQAAGAKQGADGAGDRSSGRG